MAIDWKTIISEFDGKPTLLQAIGKLRKAVEDETITIQQAQAEIAKLESQQKADEALINTAQTTANNALDLAKTNEKDIGTLDGQVAALETDLNNKQDKITKTTSLSCKKIQVDSLSFTMELGSDSTEFDYGLLFASKNVVSTGQLKPSFADEKFFEWLLPAKSGTLATTDDIRVVSSIEVILTPATATRGTLTDEQLATLLLNDNCYIKLNGIIYTLFKHNDENTILQYTAGYLNDTRNVQNIKVLVNSKAWVIENIALPQAKTYKHHVFINFTDGDSNNVFFDFVSSKNIVCDSLTDLKTVLGNTFTIQAYGTLALFQDGITTNYFIPLLLTETYLQAFYIESSGSLSLHTITLASNPFTLTDTVTTI